MKNQQDALRSSLKITGLKCNYAVRPMGVEEARPRLSWQMRSGRRGEKQTAYRILVSGSKAGLDAEYGELWDSGKICSEESNQIVYRGVPLASRMRCWWKVCVWDKDGLQSGWSEPSYWEMGLLDRSDWQARWITRERKTVGIFGSADGDPAPFFRKTVLLPGKVKNARAYICGLGYYELSVNGKKIGDHVLDPAFTQYDRTALYQAYDITDRLQAGENVFGVVLGDGWYNCFTDEVWYYKQAAWRDGAKFLLQAYVTLEDGREVTVVSDTDWKAGEGPIVFNSLRNGEIYDARREIPGWDLPSYDDSGWKNAVIARPPGGRLASQQMPPIRITGTMQAAAVQKVAENTYVYDLGQNISGWARISVRGAAGARVTLKYAENLQADGRIDQKNIKIFVLSGDFQTDEYIVKGAARETWEPRFTYHGFRYIQIEFPEGQCVLESVEGRVAHTDLETRGEFACSDGLLRKIQSCARWSLITNYHGMPTDCPHREKNGWTGDAQLSAEQLLMNYDPVTSYEKWMLDFKDAQRDNGQLPGIVPTSGWGFNFGSGPAWDSAVIIIPWNMYLYDGDRHILEAMYDTMKKYVEYMGEMAVGHIVDFGLGDWCPPTPEKTPVRLTDTAYYYSDVLLLSKIANILGKSEDAAALDELAAEIRNALRKNEINGETGAVATNSQTALSCALFQGLVDPAEAGAVLENLVAEIQKNDNHIDCGILGAKYILQVLTDHGRADVAYTLATQTTFPGWGHWIAQGATTLWESWEGNASRNHHMFGDISAWFYKALAGINPDSSQPGFKKSVLRPNPVEGLDWVRASHKCMYGLITSEWRNNGGNFTWEVEIPANTTATVYLPCGDPQQAVVDGGSLKSYFKEEMQYDGKHIKLEIGSGQYRFESRL